MHTWQPNLLLLAGPAATWSFNIGAENPGPPVTRLLVQQVPYASRLPSLGTRPSGSETIAYPARRSPEKHSNTRQLSSCPWPTDLRTASTWTYTYTPR